MKKSQGFTRAASFLLALLIPKNATINTCQELNKNCSRPEATLKAYIDEINLHCRQDKYLALSWSVNTSIQDFNLTFSLEKSKADHPFNWTFVKTVESPLAVIDRLDENTTYLFRVTPTQNNHFVGEAVISNPFTTLDGKITPEPIGKISVSNMTVQSNSINTILQWNPSKDSICFTEMIFWLEDSNQIKNTEIEIEHLYNYPLSHLQFDKNYTVGLYNVMGDLEGNHVFHNFVTPKCLEVTENNLFTCTPDPPKNLNFSVENCKVLVTWKKPDIQPSYYNMSVYHEKASYDIIFELPPTLTRFEINTSNFGNHFVITMSAVGPAGQSKEYIRTFKNKCTERNKLPYILPGIFEKKIMGGFIMVIVFFSIVFTSYLLLYYKKVFLPTNKKQVEILNGTTSFGKQESENDNLKIQRKDNDEFEVSADSVQICQVLGEGEFGIVYKAVYTWKDGQTKQVAVKMLREKASYEEKKQLVKEMELMKSVGNHKNIVSLVGCCSPKMMLIVEYCSLGDLHNFLRQVSKNRITRIDTMSTNQMFNKNLSLLSSNHEGLLAVSNILYDKPDLEELFCNITFLDLLSFARQIATGMTFLSENYVIHRDLAARNVLVCQGMTVKISDFGLSRDLYENSIYRKKSSDRLPLKWMALESLIYQVFSTKSDVWSFGVLLWEIVTLGGCPYPSIPSNKMFRLLQEGYRMEKPTSCSDKLYEIMLSCWNAHPHLRPSFLSLVEQLESLMQEESKCDYLCLCPITPII